MSPYDNKNYGVITEQGYPVGQFGFSPISENDKKSIESSEDKNQNDDDNTNKKEEE